MDTVAIQSTRDASYKPESEGAFLMIAAAAIVVIVLANTPTQTKFAPTVGSYAASCFDCGKVVSLRRAGDERNPMFYVEVQMPDGVTRTIEQLAAGFDVGDVVRVNGNALTLAI